MAEPDKSNPVYRWAIEHEDIVVADSNKILSNLYWVKAIQVLAPHRVFGFAAKVKVVRLPENYKLAPDAPFAEVLELPEDATSATGAVTVKIMDARHLPSVPKGMAVLDTVKLSSIGIAGGTPINGVRVPVIKTRHGK